VADYVPGHVCVCVCLFISCKQDITNYFATFVSGTLYILLWKRLTSGADHIQDGLLSAILVFSNRALLLVGLGKLHVVLGCCIKPCRIVTSRSMCTTYRRSVQAQCAWHHIGPSCK